MKWAVCFVAPLIILADELALHAQHKEPPKEFTNSMGMKFVWIPPGSFMMGSPKEEEHRYDDETQHKVTLTKGFYLGTYLVTQEQWHKIIRINPSTFKGEDNLPVENVTWDNCHEFLNKMSKKEGHAYRLPSESEWEYACRAGSKTVNFFGDDQKLLDQYAWYKENSGNKTHPVGQKKPNAWGLYDMHGTVWEWCADWYGEYPKGDSVDPHGPESGARRVLRGGSFLVRASVVRSANRFNVEVPTNFLFGRGFGFRVATTLAP
jgi:formylglycine-generating enzyme required for sulfatase activity